MAPDKRPPENAGKPYATYRGGGRARRRRADDVALTAGSPAKPFAWDEEEDLEPAQGAGQSPPRRRRRFRWKVFLLVSLALVLALLLAAGLWGFFAWRTVDAAVQKANHRINAATRAQLTPDGGSIFSHPTTILVLGVDKRAHDPGRSDSIVLMRSDPSTHSFSQLSIARDMRVNIPGRGMGKINTGYFWGGPALAVRTIRDFTGIAINHIVVIDFNGFPRAIDAVGGVDVYVPRTITSWYSGGQTVTFTKGWNHMDGKRAMVYARIRKVDSDFFRQARQQQILQALQKKIASFGNLPDLPSDASKIVRALSNDLTTWQLAQLAWRKWRTAHTYNYVLRGTPAMIGGQDYVVSDRAANLRMINAFMTN